MSSNLWSELPVGVISNNNNKQANSTTTTFSRTQSNKNKMTKTRQTQKSISNPLNAVNTTPMSRYPQNILDKMHPHELFYFNSQISFNLPLKNIEWIVGPHDFTILQFNGRNFFIFGEAHNLEEQMENLYNDERPLNKNITVGFDGFVRSLINEYPTFNFELYYEKTTGWIKREENNHINNKHIRTQFITSMLRVLDILFLNCSRFFDKSECEYPNLRVHHADARYYSFTRDVLVKIYYYDKLTPEQIEHWNKQLTNYVTNSKIFLKLIDKQSTGINESIKEQISTYFKALFSKPSTTQKELIDKFSLLLDYYTILRMLRNFDETKTTYGRTKHWEQKNIIGYFGYKHSENIVLLLKKLGAKIFYRDTEEQYDYPTVKIDKTKKCIDIIDELIQNGYAQSGVNL